MQKVSDRQINWQCIIILKLGEQFVVELLYDFNTVSDNDVIIDDFDKNNETSQSIKVMTKVLLFGF